MFHNVSIKKYSLFILMYYAISGVFFLICFLKKNKYILQYQWINYLIMDLFYY